MTLFKYSGGKLVGSMESCYTQLTHYTDIESKTITRLFANWVAANIQKCLKALISTKTKKW